MPEFLKQISGGATINSRVLHTILAQIFEFIR